MGEKDLYDYYNEDYKVHGIDWNQDKALQVLQAWQREFTQVGPFLNSCLSVA